MMEQVSPAVSVFFILTTFAAVGCLLHAAKMVGINSLASRILLFVLPLWIFFQGALAAGGFYANTAKDRPYLFIFGIWPAVLFVVAFVLLFRSSFISKLPLAFLLGVHIVRIPVEAVLYGLYRYRLIPLDMTFEGYNFDIVTGVLAALLFTVLLVKKHIGPLYLWIFNTIGMLLLGVVVYIAALSVPGPLQSLNFNEPNLAVLYFPYIWLPTIVVPIVLFAHLSAFVQMAAARNERKA